MGIFVYTALKSTGARDLAEALKGIRLRNFDGMDFWVKGRKIEPKAGDLMICWGHSLPELEGVKVLNGKSPGNKFRSALMLQGGGVPTIKVTPTRGEDTIIPRLHNHVGGDDLLKSPPKADFWVKKETLLREFRIHSFCGKSIRAGIKVPRAGMTPHPWVRSFDAGWRIDYENFKSTAPMRGLAHKAVKVLGLDFGAVDIGEKADGSLMILEVNRAPGIEGGSVEAYVRGINRWIEEGGLNV